MPLEHESTPWLLLAGNEELGEAAPHDHGIVRDTQRRGCPRRRVDFCLITLRHESHAHPGWSDQAVDHGPGHCCSDRETEAAKAGFVPFCFGRHLANEL